MLSGNEMNAIGEFENAVLMELGLNHSRLFVCRDCNELWIYGSQDRIRFLKDKPLVILCHAGLILPIKTGPFGDEWGLSGDGIVWVARELSERRYSMPSPRVLWDLN